MKVEAVKFIRKATISDISRIAEILIFTKRVQYRSIFNNDKVSFGEMQVLPLAEEYFKDPQKLNEIWLYDDEFVKGLITFEQCHEKERSHICIKQLYVDPFFQHQGIGKALIERAVKEATLAYLWVLEKNQRAIIFYEKNDFIKTTERMLEPGTPEYIIKMIRKSDKA